MSAKTPPTLPTAATTLLPDAPTLPAAPELPAPPGIDLAALEARIAKLELAPKPAPAAPPVAPPKPVAPPVAPPSLRSQIEAQFTYHPPTPAQAPKYAAITEAREQAQAIVLAEGSGRNEPDYKRVNAVLKQFAIVILDNAPSSADTTAAIRCVRLARNAANALLREPGNGQLQAIAIANLYQAQWQANSAIALEGK